MATDGAVISSVDELNNFETLKAVADDIQAKKDDLGIEGAFASTGFDSSSDWRFKTHLANLPIYYEYKADGINSTDAIKGTYLDNYKQICRSLHQQIPPVSRLYFPARLVRMQLPNSHLARLSSIRMVPGHTMISKITK